MANWLLAIDENEDRRAAYIAGLEARICPIDGLVVDSRHGTGWSAAWSAAKSAPVDLDTDAAGGAFVWGEARNALGEMQKAKAIREAWRNGAVAQWDGFYSAVVFDETNRLCIAGTDLLGIFPVYYWTDNKGVSLIATSPELFRGHPRFTPEISITGLVGILLTNGLVDGRSLWRDVYRLAPGHRVRIENGRVREDVGYVVPTETQTTDLPFVGHVQQLEESVSAAVMRHAPKGRQYGLMLSGGLDSRLLAGFLAEQSADVKCLTFGQPHDIEMRCAKAVAKSVGYQHIATDVKPDSYADAAQRLARWEVMAAGFSGVQEWAMHEAIENTADRIITGHIFDGMVGGIHIGWAYDSNRGKMTFEHLLPTILAWGIEPEALKLFFEPEARKTVDDVMERMRQIYNTMAGRDHHKAWLFDLQYRQRFHVGSALWPASFSAWPVIPCLDRDVLAVSAALPCSSISDRRAQSEILTRRFPTLAGLPIDRNSSDMLPQKPQLADYVLRSLNYRIQSAKDLAGKLFDRKEAEKIYYRRIYDIDSPGWRDIRKLAEPHRGGIASLFANGKIVDNWPALEQSSFVNNPVKDFSIARNLMGLALCNRYMNES